MDDDQICWKGLMDGDKEMFLSLYKKYYHSLLFIGLKEIKNPQLVKDTIQQLFLYLWEKRGSIKEAKNIKAYSIKSFLRKLTIDWKKSGKDCNLEAVGNYYFEDPQITPEEKLINNSAPNLAISVSASITFCPYFFTVSIIDRTMAKPLAPFSFLN